MNSNLKLKLFEYSKFERNKKPKILVIFKKEKIW